MNSLHHPIEHPRLRTRRTPVGGRTVELPASPWAVVRAAEAFAPAPALDRPGDAIRAEVAARAP